MGEANSFKALIDQALQTGEPQRLSTAARDQFMAKLRAEIAPKIDAHRARQRRLLGAMQHIRVS